MQARQTSRHRRLGATRSSPSTRLSLDRLSLAFLLAQDWEQHHHRLPSTDGLKSDAEKKGEMDRVNHHRQVGKKLVEVQAQIDAEVAAFSAAQEKKRKDEERRRADEYFARLKRTEQEAREEKKRLRKQMEKDVCKRVTTGRGRRLTSEGAGSPPALPPWPAFCAVATALRSSTAVLRLPLALATPYSARAL